MEVQNLITNVDTVVITGFGLFRDHQLNPSWEAIKEGQLVIDREINVVTKQIPVSYQEVDKVVEELWTQHRPMLMIHVGLAAHEDHIRLESMARHGPYIHDDINRHAPHKELRQYNTTIASSQQPDSPSGRPSYTCKPCEFDTSRTILNVENVCQKLNELHKRGQVPIGFKCSHDAGLYVCEYLYKASLKICPRVVFIHVPDVKKFTLEQIRLSLKFAIEALIDELNEL